MTDLLFAPAVTLWGSAITWLEIVAVMISLATILCNIREIHWAWPLAIVASSMYFALFWHSRLYGNALLQVFFAVVSMWGWWQWRRPARAGSPVRISRLTARGRLAVLASCMLLWPAIGWFLYSHTDTDVPWWDAFPTAVSLVAQFLLGRKYLENWVLWMVVDVVSVALYVHKGLWLTAILYAAFFALSAAGLRTWHRRMA
jgi:nicotinamide mononucleotide transporter